MKNTTHQTWHPVLLTAMLLTLFPGCAKKTPPPPAPPAVTVTAALQQNVRRYYDLTGNTEAVESVDILARVEGFLKEAHFEDGDDVKEGDLLFTIEPDVFEANVDQAVAAKESAIAERQRAESDFKRVKQAVSSGAVSEQELDLKQAEYDIAVAAVARAEASLKQAKLQLSYTAVTSPVSGRVSRRFVDVGNLVSPTQNTLLTRVVRFDPLYVYSNISEALLSQILKKSGQTDQERRKVDAKLFIGLADEEGFPHEGVLNFIDNQLDAATGTVQIRGTVPNKNRLLYPGMFVRIRIPSLKETPSLLVHEKAIGTDLGGKFLLVVREEVQKEKDGTVTRRQFIVERRYVTLGQLYENMRVIEKGIKPTDRYIYKGIQRARPGMSVTPQEESESEADKSDAN